MGQVSRSTLKTYFETSDKPTQTQFEDLIDSSARNFIDASAYDSLQIAINNASSGDTVYVFGQSYEIDTRITISTDDVTLNLHNSNIKVSDNADITLFEVTGNRSGIINGTIDGNRANQPGNFKAMVFLNGADDSFCKNVYIKDSDGYGIHSKDSRRSIIFGNRVVDSRYIGIYSLVKDLTTNIEGSKTAWNIVDRRGLGSSAVEGGIKIHQSGGTSGTYQTEDWEIVNNRVYFDPAASTNECYVASGNYGNFSGNYGYGHAIGVTMVGTGNICTNNIFEEQGSYGIEFTKSTSLTVSSNIIDGKSVTDRGIANTSDSLNPSTNITITSNVVRDCAENNYWIRNTNNSTVSGNISIGRSYYLEACDIIQFVGNVVSDGGNNINGLTAIDTEKISIMANSFSLPNSTNAISFSSSDAGFEPEDVIITSNYFNNTGATITTNGLTSGSIGDGWVVRDNTGSLGIDYMDYKNDVRFRAFGKDPNGWGGAGIGSLTTDYTNGKLYINTDGSSTGWEVVGTQT